MADIQLLKRKLNSELDRLERLDAVLAECERGGSEIYETPAKLQKLYREMTISEAKLARLERLIQKAKELSRAE